MSQIQPIGDASHRGAGHNLAELQRMRLWATGLLMLMLALFVACSGLASVWPFLVYPRAFAEAAMVGACADWFAVVALFRHPLGIPIPHTAIVPRQKQRIGESLGRFIANNFLAPTEVMVRLESIDAAGWLARWLTEGHNTTVVATRLRGLFPPLLDLLGEDQIRSFSRGMIRSGIDSIAAAPLAARVLSVLIAHGHHDAVFDVVIQWAQSFLDGHKSGIRQHVAKNSARWLPGWVDGKLTDAVLGELRETLAAAHAPDHPWRGEYRAVLTRLITEMAEDPQMLAEGERLKTEVLSNAVVDGYLDWLGGEVESKIQTELAATDGVLTSGLEHALLALSHWLENDARIRALINGWAHRLVLNAVVPNRAEIGAFVAGVVAKWNTTTLVDKLELQVGKDLQYIRINGTVVGGLVGLVIFTVSHLVGVNP